MRARRLLVLIAGLLLAGCATTPPAGPMGSPSPDAYSSPALPSSVTPTPTPTATATESSATPSATPTDAGANLILRGDGLGAFDFGAKQALVVELLSDQLGAPDESSQGILCELNDASPWAETQSYGGLWVQFVAKDKKKASPRTLAAWGFSLAEEFGEPLQMADDVPLTLGFKALKAKYPDGKLEDTGFGDGSKIFTLPDGIRFIGAGKPDTVQAGELSFCE